MLKALANENAEDDRATAIRDTLMVARKFLIENKDEVCDLSAPGAGNSKRGAPHEHGSARCIAHFLSDRTWSEHFVVAAITDFLMST
jgi:hypothetical protein